MASDTTNAAAQQVLVTGAAGFIGRHLVARLRAEGHEVVGSARNLEQARRIIPDIEWREGDFNRDTTPEAWRPRLAGITAVINCAGILQSGRVDDIDKVHTTGPVALFEAAKEAGISRVIQISALGAEAAAGTAYATSKESADAQLRGMALDWVVVYPSLVYARDCYGGTALFRGLAALPFILPLPGGGEQAFQPIHMNDLAAIVARLLAPSAPNRINVIAVGPEVVSLREISLAYRRWLGLKSARVISVPMALIRLAAKVADLARWFGGRGALSTTSVRQLEFGNTADPDPRVGTLGIIPRKFAQGLAREPAGVPERWHARLYFLKPALRVTLGLFWLWTGLSTAFFHPVADSQVMMAAVGIPEALYGPTFWLGSAFDVVLGLLLLFRWRVTTVAGVGIVATIGYLILLSFGMPELWTHPLGPYSKLIPLMVAMGIMIAIEEDR